MQQSYTGARDPSRIVAGEHEEIRWWTKNWVSRVSRFSTRLKSRNVGPVRPPPSR
jgi:hypothetical protein